AVFAEEIFGRHGLQKLKERALWAQPQVEGERWLRIVEIVFVEKRVGEGRAAEGENHGKRSDPAGPAVCALGHAAFLERNSAYEAAVRRNPSSSEKSGSQPNSRRALAAERL